MENGNGTSCMKYHKWSRAWPARYKIMGMVLLVIVTGVFILNDRTQNGQAESIAVVQMSVPAEAETMASDSADSERTIKRAQNLLQMGWAIADGSTSLRDEIWRLLADILPENGYWHVANGIPLLKQNGGRITKIIAEEEAYYASAVISDIWKHSFEKVGNLTLSEDVQVILYHTHNAETYLPDDGVSKVSGQNGGVVDAADVFQEALQKKYGIRTVHSTTIHDYPDWNRSYQNSLNTAKQLLQAYPEAKAVFDIHRDAGFTSKKTTTATVHGKSAAKIMMVIGCNHDNWQENLAFARLLEVKCNELYPGLLRDNIHIKETGRYNQQVNGHAVLLEIGSDLNTQAEAEYSMECFAHVVYEVLAEQESESIS